METITVALNFAGFYQSIHNDNIEARISQVLEDEDILDDKIYNHIPYKAIYTEYAERYVSEFNHYFNLNLEFLELDSPREYNFRTDVIMVNMCIQDYNFLWLDTDQDFINDKIEEASTFRDGYVPYYSRSEILAQPEFVGEFLLDWCLNDYEEALDYTDVKH